jgi:hypothetical protein
LLILFTWSFLESYFIENKRVPSSFILVIGILIVFHVAYYLVFLNSFPEHRQLVEQWTIAWLLQAENFIPAYLLAVAIAIWPVRRFALAKEFFRVPHNRLLAVWALVAFVLANHEFAIRPIQPIHFDRGYIWTPLFLMGATSLVLLFKTCWYRLPRVVGVLCLGALIFLFLSDNAAWLASFAIRKDQGFRLTTDEVELLGWFNSRENEGTVVLCQDPDLGYMATVYSPLRAWASHWGNTPARRQREAEINDLFREGKFLDRWRTMRLVIVFTNESEAQEAALPPEREGPVFQNGTFTLFRLAPKAAPSSP